MQSLERRESSETNVLASRCQVQRAREDRKKVVFWVLVVAGHSPLARFFEAAIIRVVRFASNLLT